MIALLWCWATLAHTGCDIIGFYDTQQACHKALVEAKRFDTRALRVTGLPAVVSYHCEQPK